MGSITSIKKIAQHGGSLTIAVTNECDWLNVGRGDWVRITIETIDEKKEGE